MKKKPLLLLLVAFFVLASWIPQSGARAAGEMLYWSEEDKGVYEPLLAYTLEWSGDVLKYGGFDLDTMTVTTDKNTADVVINQYGDIGARRIAELPQQALTDPVNLDKITFPTDGLGYPLLSLKLKANGLYLIEMDNGQYAKLRIDQSSSTKVTFSFVLQTAEPPEDDDETPPPTDGTQPPKGTVTIIDLTAPQQNISVKTGAARSVLLIALYSNKTKKDVTAEANWKSQYPHVATVSKGKIQGISPGEAVITAEYRGLKKTFWVNVTGTMKPVKPIKGITGTAIAAGSDHTLVLKRNGTVWSFGWNQTGQLGNGNTTNQSKPVQVIGLKNVKAIAAGYNFSLALKKDGTVWMWGSPFALIDGPRPFPYQIQSLKNIVAIAAGEEHMMALRKDGTVWSWGNNSYGQGGIGRTSPATIERPVKVLGLTKVVSIGVGRFHSLAVRSGGSVYAWGNNERGQIGNGKSGFDLMDNVLKPYKIPLITKVKKVTGGTYYSLAVKADGTAWSWGHNDQRQLGLPYNNMIQNRPAQIRGENGGGYLQQMKQIDGGYRHTVAVANNGTTYAWGENRYGKLGNNKATNAPYPVKVPITKVVAVEAGTDHTVALRSDGTVLAWGSNGYGQLGIGSKYRQRNAPVKVMNAK
ncbi:hypothetical protein JK635_13605 [Neobacillus sp. YIM B02564]|uniref:RCC1-like domain-containing protein n=1 Tax=Neobacillus paridis TaxID=2803862 RepID=A0ABS1TSK2_9BACI|nr:hypothetical protein [Neobacillus paridis]MBL4953246.1 hypothetical protein [Neobacillus paridis]